MKINTLVDMVNIETIFEDISNVLKESDAVYYFDNNVINSLENNKLYKKETFNYFSIYNKNIYMSLSKIKEMFKTICANNEINIDKNMYYIESEYFENIDTLFWYDSGGDRPLCFSGYIILKCEDNSTVSIDGEVFELVSGTVILSRSNSKIIWNNSVSGINFNIAPISMLHGQYKQKWIPM